MPGLLLRWRCLRITLAWGLAWGLILGLALQFSQQAQAQAQPQIISVQMPGAEQSMVGTWAAQGVDWVLFFQANGQGALVGTNADSSCAGVSTKTGNYTASGGSLVLTGDARVGCNGTVNQTQTPGSISAGYVISGNTLTLTNVSVNSKNIKTLTLTLVPEQTTSIVGTWTSAGTDFVWNFQADGKYGLTGLGVGPACTGSGSERGTYSAAAGVLNFSTETYTCNGVSVSGVGDAAQGRYAFTGGNTLTLFGKITSGQHAGEVAGFILSPQGPAAATVVAPTTPLPLPPTTQTVFAAATGALPSEAVQVEATGTFGRATLKVTLTLTVEVAKASAAAFAASPTYNAYVVAMIPAAVLGTARPVFYSKTRVPENWGPLTQPIAAYLENVAQSAIDNQVVIDILTNDDISALVGTEVYVGYGTSSDEMLAKGRYRGVYKAQ